MGSVSAAAAAIGALLSIVTILGVSVVWLRRSISTERDDARKNTIAALREIADVQEHLNETRLTERDEYIGRLERHHSTTHRRCETGPRRDG